ncbi:gfo/Idh/MocA family oxidoreductase [Nocardiopsis gilva YIM 90087]|uniref:Gfo/Idh/MocA family oxidoreductase n=1 Tax=Nocardiopsis gilva YIM 90087 TaxID=1235441 RepID=A0A223S3A6_9ACTN|nr:Gfo/Idh/MocA family oxidoreductase [Nocardiopsis gilva]ASU82601.1 gfo/Idh/MocA family oxidoreductase [Nocardiopsis gilva YIM 90087]
MTRFAADSTTLRWGVLGATSYISTHVMPGIARTPGCELSAVASRPERAAAAAEVGRSFGATVHPDYGTLLADDALDAVYIPLPNSDHVDWTLRALAAGKHVLVEKPMAMTENDCVRIEKAAEAASRTVMEAFMYRFHPQQRRTAELLASGEIGELRVVRASFAFGIESGSGNIRLEPSLGGGATWDVGCYAVDVPLLFFGHVPQTVSARFSRRPGIDVETSAVATMDFGQGRSAVVDYSIDYGPRSYYELQGTRGSITVRNAWAMEGEDGVITVLTHDGIREETIPSANHYQLQVAAFAEAVRDNVLAPMSLADSRNTARVGASLVASAAADGANIATTGDATVVP